MHLSQVHPSTIALRFFSEVNKEQNTAHDVLLPLSEKSLSLVTVSALTQWSKK
jgi:hypothetical protein